LSGAPAAFPVMSMPASPMMSQAAPQYSSFGAYGGMGYGMSGMGSSYGALPTYGGMYGGFPQSVSFSQPQPAATTAEGSTAAGVTGSVSMGAMPSPMSYVPSSTSFGYPGYGMPGMHPGMHMPHLEVKTIEGQRDDATKALNGQADLQKEMLTNQFETQKEMYKAECDRNIKMMEQHFQQELAHQTFALEAQFKEQMNQLEMARQQRSMAIEQQAANMIAQAHHFSLQRDMHERMASLYSNQGKAAKTSGTDKTTTKASNDSGTKAATGTGTKGSTAGTKGTAGKTK